MALNSINNIVTVLDKFLTLQVSKFSRGGRYSGHSMSISVHKIFIMSLGLEPTSLNRTQDMQIIFISIFDRKFFYWRNAFLYRQEVCVSPLNVGGEETPRERSRSCIFFGIFWSSCLGRDVGYFNWDISCVFSVPVIKFLDSALNTPHDLFPPLAFKFTIR